MKGVAAVALAAMAVGANAVNHRHAHELFKRGADKTCGCTTIYYTTTGEATLVPAPPATTSSAPPAPPVTTSTTPVWTPTPEVSTSVVLTTSIEKLPVPTPEPITCPTPGTYTITASTKTVTEETTVCVGSSTHVTAGTHTVGGVTTVVDVPTTVTCGVPTVTTSGSIVHSTIVSTEYVCPSAGTYTIAPHTTTVTEECDIEVPVTTVYHPGTYTQAQETITVTVNDYVYVCPFSSSEAPKPKPTVVATQSKVEIVKTTSEAPKATVEVAKPKVEVNKSETKTKTKTTSSSGHYSGSFGGNDDHYGITYTPYDSKTGDCKSASAVEQDIKTIKNDGFEVVRVYSTDCSTLEFVGDACKKHGLGMIVGVFVKETGCSAQTAEIAEQISALKSWKNWDLVKLLVVGNEAIHQGHCSASELAQLVKTVKSECSSYTGPVTVAEVLDDWLQSEVSDALCDLVDFTGANVHPFFNANNLASLAGIFVKGQLTILDGICPGKTAVNLECGWPNAGNCLGKACPGTDEQAEALASIRKVVGGKTVFFSFENDAWKAPGEYNCEQHWGTKEFFSISA